jgi:hypothetical protein
MDRPNEYVAELKDVEGSPCIVCSEGHLEVPTFTKNDGAGRHDARHEGGSRARV